MKIRTLSKESWWICSARHCYLFLVWYTPLQSSCYSQGIKVNVKRAHGKSAWLPAVGHATFSMLKIKQRERETLRDTRGHMQTDWHTDCQTDCHIDRDVASCVDCKHWRSRPVGGASLFALAKWKTNRRRRRWRRAPTPIDCHALLTEI